MCSRVQHLIGATVAWLRGGGPGNPVDCSQPCAGPASGKPAWRDSAWNEGQPHAEQLETYSELSKVLQDAQMMSSRELHL